MEYIEEKETRAETCLIESKENCGDGAARDAQHASQSYWLGRGWHKIKQARQGREKR